MKDKEEEEEEEEGKGEGKAEEKVVRTAALSSSLPSLAQLVLLKAVLLREHPPSTL